MSGNRVLSLSILVAFLVVLGCFKETLPPSLPLPAETREAPPERPVRTPRSDSFGPRAAETSEPAPERPVRRESFDARLLGIARDYQASYELLEPEMRPAGTLCDFTPRRIVAGIDPEGSLARGFEFRARATTPSRSMKLSTSQDDATHGRKLYLVLSRFRLLRLYEKPHPVGQAVVKESWVPEEVEDTPANWKPTLRVFHEPPSGKFVNVKPVEKPTLIVPCARADGKVYRAARKYGLFVMFKTDPKTPETDAGWVYGTVSADGKTVLSIGKLASCMKCHQDAPNDRIFGH